MKKFIPELIMTTKEMFMDTTARTKNPAMERKRTILLGASFLISLAFVLCSLVGKAEAICEPEPTDMSVAYGELITCDISPVEDADLYRFSGNAGDRIFVEALWVSGDNFVPYIKLIAPDGTLLGSTWSPARLEIDLPQTGTYTAIISDFQDNNTGEYAFIATCAGGSCILLPPPPPQDPPGENTGCEPEPTDMFVQYGERVTCDIAPVEDTDFYRFSGNAGDRILVDALWVSGDNFVPYIKLIAPDGTQLGSTWSPARLEIVLPQTGTYTAIISDFQDNNIGEYAFTVFNTSGCCLPPEPLACDIQMSQLVYLTGDTVTATVFRIANPGADPVSVEWAVWLGTPFGPPISFINIGANGTFVLPAGFDLDMGPFALFSAAILPSGFYEFSCRIVDPVTKKLLAIDLNPFEIR